MARVIESLTPSHLEIEYYEQDLEIHRHKVHKSSCHWILGTQQYKTWASCPADSYEKLLWISAVPGAGKTILSAFLIHHLRTVPGASASPVLFVMFQARHLGKRAPIAAARTLTYQLLKSLKFQTDSLFEALVQHRNRSGSPQPNDFQSLWDLFSEHIVKLSSAIVVVDALDECEEDSTLCACLLKLSQAAQVKVLITSRREASLSSLLDNHLSLNFGAKENQQDIYRYLTHEISNSPKLSKPIVSNRVIERFNMDLPDYLLHRANGLFLWVSLALKELEMQITMEDLLRTVDELPSGLAEVYALVLHKIPASKRGLCRPILRWLACAYTPLSVSEMWQALSIELVGRDGDFLASQREIECACGSLVVIENGKMHLAHQSLAEFLCKHLRETKLGSSIAEFSVDVSDAHFRNLALCLGYMDTAIEQLGINPNIKMRTLSDYYLRSRYAFLEYAVFCWTHHLMSLDFREGCNHARVSSLFFWGDRWLYWIEFWFVLRAQESWGLAQHVERLSSWCNDSIKDDHAGPHPPTLFPNGHNMRCSSSECMAQRCRRNPRRYTSLTRIHGNKVHTQWTLLRKVLLWKPAFVHNMFFYVQQLSVTNTLQRVLNTYLPPIDWSCLVTVSASSDSSTSTARVVRYSWPAMSQRLLSFSATIYGLTVPWCQ